MGMRILHICQRDDPDTGGALRVAEALIKEQRNEGHEAWILFLYGPPSGISKRFASNTYCLELTSSKYALQGIVSLRRAIRRIAPDIIHSHDGIVWPRIALMNIPVPRVMHSHLPVGPRKTLKQRMAWMLVRGTTDYLIGISQHTSQTWLDAGFPIRRISYLPNGVDFDRFSMPGSSGKTAIRERLGLPIDKRILLWVGRLHQSMKGSDRVEYMAGQLPDDIALVVVGNGPAYAGMLERCARLMDAGKLFMVGSASSPEEYYMAADAYLFTSYHEPFGLVILEAVASGLPILSFPVTGGGGAVELLKEFNAVQVEDGASPAQVGELVEQVLGLSGESTSNRIHAREKYSWTQISRQLTGVYEQLASPPVPAAPLLILHICQRDDMRTGGATRIAFDLVMGQRERGADAHLLFLYGKPGSLGWRLLPSKCAHYLGLDSATEVFGRGWTLARFIHEFKPAVVHHHDMLLWPQFIHLCPHRYQMVFHAHLDYRPPRSIKPSISWRLILKNSDAILTPSSHGRSRLLETRHPPERISVIPNGTEIPRHCNSESRSNRLRSLYRLEPDHVVLGWGGRLHCDTKGTDDFIRLFGSLPEHYVGIIAGQGPDEEMLRQLVKDLGFGDRVFFHGLEEDMNEFYRGVDAFVITSHFESFGLVVIEALANRVPVFAFPVRGGINDLFSLPGLYPIPERSLRQMACRITEVLDTHESLFEDVEKGCASIAEKYSIQKMAENSLHLYETLGNE